eukprot:s9170_g1.t1
MASLDKEARNKKCLQCGSESHRARECPVGKTQPRGVPGPTSPNKDGRARKPNEAETGRSTLSTVATVASQDAASLSSSSTLQGTPWTLEALVQAAQQVVQSQQPDSGGDKSPEKTRPELRILVVRDIKISALSTSSSALLDSGATHSLRNAHDSGQWDGAEDVLVQLAGTSKLAMRMSSTGTLLMPPRATPRTTGSSETGGQTIVSLGELVRTLGYTLIWSPDKCVLKTAEGEELLLTTRGGCPHLCEAEALALIARLEDRKRDRLENETATTLDRLEMAALRMDRGWFENLREFVETDSMEAGVMKNVNFLTRPQRRYLWTAKKWVVHLFAGSSGHDQIFHLDDGGTAVIELDLHRCRGHDIMDTAVWRMVMWGAVMGKVDAVLGGPPGRGGVQGDTSVEDEKGLKPLKLITRMMWLYATACAARRSSLAGGNKDRPVAFMMEHPAEDACRGKSLWSTCTWKIFEEEMGMCKLTFNQEAMGGEKVKTTIGTNVYYLMGLDRVGTEDNEEGDGLMGSSGEQRGGPIDEGEDHPVVKGGGFVGSTKEQQEGRLDYEDSLYDPSEPGEGGYSPHEEGQTGDPRAVPRDRVDYVIQDCEAPEATYLLFARPLASNTSAVVKAAIQDVILYLQARGLPVYRLHSDKGEVYCHSIRSWLRDQGVRATFSEPGVPQGNGAAEGTVRWLKDKARTMLIGAKLPTRLWPTAVEAAAAIQRARVLGGKSKLLAPYGAPVCVKQKAFDSSGPRRRERAFETRWTKGVYVGLSNILDNGHVVFIPGSDTQQERFMHTFHVRAGLVDPGRPAVEVPLPEVHKPRRRLAEKTPLEQVELKGLSLAADQLAEYIQDRSRVLLDSWSQEGAINLVDELAEHGFFDELKFGVFRHGGSVGWLKGFKEFPELTKVLARIILHDHPEATFTALMVAKTNEKGMHRDFNNDEGAVNYVMPIRMPRRGGDLWVELGPGDRIMGEVIDRQDDQGRTRYGQLYKLTPGTCNVFSPRRLHDVLPWEGQRVVLIAYTPQGLGKITDEMIKELEEYEFVPPLTQYPEYFLFNEDVQVNFLDADETEENAPADHKDVEDLQDTDADMEEWEMFLDTPKGRVKIGDQELDAIEDAPQGVHKLEVTYTKGVEAIIAGLKGPLEVTYTVDPREVHECLDKWAPAIRKEVEGVSVTILNKIDRRRGTNAKRKWQVRLIDIIQAFLRTPLDPAAGDPTFIVTPPKILEKLLLTTVGEMWGLVRALYGLRQAPALWSSHRDRVLREMVFPGQLQLRQGRTITAWWVLKNQAGVIIALIIIYVDDILLLGEEPTICAIAETIQKTWKTFPLAILTSECPLRFLGMELEIEPETNNLYLNQRGYIEEILRAHNVPEGVKDKIPVAKEQSSFELLQEDAPPTPEAIAEGQRITGEVMWIAQRTRPDLAYTCSLMASITLR